MKRKVAQLEDHKNLLDRLVDTFRYSTNEHFLQVLELIRYKKASLEEIKEFLRRNVSDSELEITPELMAIQSALEKRAQLRSKHRILDVTWLSHIPVVEVSAKPWTRVTDDDGLVSYLISLWLTWSHPFCNWIDREMFIRDMKLGNVCSKFCSPFLVNSILAEACVSSPYSNLYQKLTRQFYSDYPEVFKDPSDPNSKGMHFYEEAKRLLEMEEGRISIPTVQGYAALLTR